MNRIELKRLARYDDDFALWAAEQAALLRSGRLDRLDVENLAEEIDDLAARVKKEIRSRLEVLLVHLLKWQHQPEKRTPSWTATIKLQRLELDDLIDENPSLKTYPAERLARSYRLARVGAAAETGLQEKTFPDTCPFPIAEILDPEFLPADR